MILYCIEFIRETEDSKTISKFFAYDKTKISAVLRFLLVTGYDKKSIKKVFEVKG